MTTQKFERLLKKINPNLHIRKRGYGDIAGVYDGSKYLVRLSHGELNLNGYYKIYYTSDGSPKMGPIAKRGRKTIIEMLQKKGYIKNIKQRSMLLWGLE